MILDAYPELKGSGFYFGALPVRVSKRCNLSPMARLLFVVLDGLAGKKQRFAAAHLDTLAAMLGLSTKSKKSVLRYLVELVRAGFLDVEPQPFDRPLKFYPKLPDYCVTPDPTQADQLQTMNFRVNVGDWRPARWPDQPAGQLQRCRPGSWEDQPATADQDQAADQDRAPAPADKSSIVPPAPAVLVPEPTPNSDSRQIPPRERESCPPTATPEFWDGFAEAYQDAYQGRRLFVWTETNIQIAERINKQLSGNQGQIEGAQANFLKNEFWKNKFHPLPALEKQLSDFLPLAPAPAVPVHKHAWKAAGEEISGDGNAYREKSVCECGQIHFSVWLNAEDWQKDEWRKEGLIHA